MHKSRCPRVTKQVTTPIGKFCPVTRPHFTADRKGRCVRRKGKIINQDIILEKNNNNRGYGSVHVRGGIIGQH